MQLTGRPPGDRCIEMQQHYVSKDVKFLTSCRKFYFLLREISFGLVALFARTAIHMVGLIESYVQLVLLNASSFDDPPVSGN
jgi:hypothetical protein